MGEDSHEEAILAKWMTVIFAVITIILFSIFIYQHLTRLIGADPAPDIIYLGSFLLFFAMTLNFRKLKIKISSEGISAGNGIFKNTVSWEEVEEVYLVETSPAWYNGWGIRVGGVEGNWRLVYNVIGGPRVVISSKNDIFRELVFSAKDPEEEMETIKEKQE